MPKKDIPKKLLTKLKKNLIKIIQNKNLKNKKNKKEKNIKRKINPKNKCKIKNYKSKEKSN